MPKSQASAAPADVYLPSFSFALKISGEGKGVDAAFQEVSGLSTELGTEDVVCGGENRFKFRLPTTGTFSNLVLKRGIILGSEKTELITWCQTTLTGGLANAIKTKNIDLFLLNAKQDPCMQWTFQKAYPVKWAMSDLNAMENRLLIESIELAYQNFIVSYPKPGQKS